MALARANHEADAPEDEETIVPWLRIVGLLLVGLALMGVHGWREYDGLTDPETMEMAALARNMAQGRGFVASCVRPADLWFLSTHAKTPVTVEHMPDLRHGPVFPSLLAAIYMGAGLDATLPMADFTRRVEDYVILPMTIIFTLLAGLLVFFATRELLGDGSAQLALAMYVLSLPVLHIGLWGGATALVLFLGAAGMLAVVRCVAQRDGRHGDETAGWLAPLFLAGFLAGLAILTSYGAWVMGLPFLIYLFHGPDRKRCWGSCVIFLAIVLTTVIPWGVRNVIVTGAPCSMTPHLALNHSALFEGDGFDASLHPLLGNLAVTRAVKAKLLSNSLDLLTGNIATVGAGVLVILLGASLFVQFERERLVALRRATLGGVGAAIGVMALSGEGTMGGLLPCILVLATAGFFALIHNIDFREPERETLAILALLLWIAAPSALALLGSREHRAYPPYHPPFIRHISGLLSRGETLCTDIPWATAWYGGRTSVLLPRSVDALLELRQNVPSLAGLYITSETARQLYSEPGTKRARMSWRPLLLGQIPSDFPFTEAIAFPASSRDQWFFTDSKHLSSH